MLHFSGRNPLRSGMGRLVFRGLVTKLASTWASQGGKPSVRILWLAIHLAWMEATFGHQNRSHPYPCFARRRACLGGSAVWGLVTRRLICAGSHMKIVRARPQLCRSDSPGKSTRSHRSSWSALTHSTHVEIKKRKVHS